VQLNIDAAKMHRQACLLKISFRLFCFFLANLFLSGVITCLDVFVVDGDGSIFLYLLSIFYSLSEQLS
jgi:hypothetical protein